MFQIAAPFSAMWIMQKMGWNRGVQFVSVRRIGGMCFLSNEKASGNDKNRVVNQQKRGGNARIRGGECERGRSARKKGQERTKDGKEKTKAGGGKKAKCRSLRRSFPELHQRTDAFLRGMLHDGLIGRLPIGVEREGRGGTLLFVQEL